MGLAMACRLPQHVLDNEGSAPSMAKFSSNIQGESLV